LRFDFETLKPRPDEPAPSGRDCGLRASKSKRHLAQALMKS